MSELQTLADRAASQFDAKKVSRALHRVFHGEHRDNRLVLAWLAHVCGATESSFDQNPFEMAAKCGRREVWVALQNGLGITEDQLSDLLEHVANGGT